MPVLALNLHAGFACRHSGACCTAGWPIPVEAAAAEAIRAHAIVPATASSTAGELPEGAAAVLVPLPGGDCPAFDRAGGSLCRIQRQLGHSGLPASCRHFPRVALLESDATRVTLSHFCPTAAWTLFRHDISRLDIVADAAGIADRGEHDGFDARHTIAPLLRPGVAMDAGTCRRWERYTMGALDTDGLSAEDALAGIARSAEAMRGWTAGAIRLEDHAAHVTAAAAGDGHPASRCGMPLTNALRLCSGAAASVPQNLKRPDAPVGLAAADIAWVSPRWAARETMIASRPLDEALLHAAIRSADLLLCHLSDTAVLVERLGFVEREPTQGFQGAIGLEAAG